MSSKWSLASTPGLVPVGSGEGQESPAGCRWPGQSPRVPARGQGTGSAWNHQPLSQTPPGDSLPVFSR